MTLESAAGFPSLEQPPSASLQPLLRGGPVHPMLKLQLGAFDKALPGWLNTDITPHLYVARLPGLAALLGKAGLMNAKQREQHRRGVFRHLHRLDATRPFPFSRASVDAIHISHMLSNLTRENAAGCIAECRRVLKAGGILRVSTVDLDSAVRSYDSSDPDHFLDLLFDLGTSSRAKNRHWWHYNETSLGALLRSAGFGEVYRCEFREGRCPDVEMVDSRPGSLFMEAIG